MKDRDDGPWTSGSGESMAILTFSNASQTNRVRRSLLLKLEEALVTREGFIDGASLSHEEGEVAEYWHEIHFIEYRLIGAEDTVWGRKPWNGCTHRTRFSPEAWRIAQECRRVNSGVLSLPSIAAYEDVVEDTEGNVNRHPAYGTLSVTRALNSRGTTLFASDFRHDSFIEVELHGAEVERSIHSNHVFARDRKFTIRMSEMQWGAFLSSFNQGGGVPCTITFDSRGRLPECPYLPEVNDFRHDLDGAVETISQTLDEVLKMAGALSAEKAIKKGAFADLVRRLATAQRDLTANLPFLKECYEDAMAKTLGSAKREIEAKLMLLKDKIGEAGLQALSDSATTALSLPASDERKE